MRKNIFISLLSLASISCAQNQYENSSNKIKLFYSYYISEMNRTFPSSKINKDTLQKYCTKSFLERTKKETEYDAILQAQDYYEEFADKLVVTQINSSDKNKYSICYPDTSLACITVTMKKEQGRWKIDDTQKK